jgi:hypothetical protein
LATRRRNTAQPRPAISASPLASSFRPIPQPRFSLRTHKSLTRCSCVNTIPDDLIPGHHGQAGISPEMAVRLEKAGWSNAGHWLRTQSAHDLVTNHARARWPNETNGRALRIGRTGQGGPVTGGGACYHQKSVWNLRQIKTEQAS